MSDKDKFLDEELDLDEEKEESEDEDLEDNPDIVIFSFVVSGN